VTRKRVVLLWASAAGSWLLMVIPWTLLRLLTAPVILWQEIHAEASRCQALAELEDLLRKKIGEIQAAEHRAEGGFVN
jgi:hypothetical protein